MWCIHLNRGGLTIPGDTACQWSSYSYVTFREVADYTCRKSLCNILIMISEFHGLNMNTGRPISYLKTIIIYIHHGLIRK